MLANTSLTDPSPVVGLLEQCKIFGVGVTKVLKWKQKSEQKLAVEIDDLFFSLQATQHLIHRSTLFGRDAYGVTDCVLKCLWTRLTTEIIYLIYMTIELLLSCICYFLQELSSEGRPNARRILVVITDKKSTSDLKDVTKEGQELEMEDIRVIPVALGGEADLNELQKITPWLDDIIETDKDDNPYTVAVKILTIGLKGG